MKITLIVPYFGTWPVWFPAFLLSCRYNPCIEWLLFTDCEVPFSHCDNVHFVPGSLDALSTLASEKLGFKTSISRPYKVCDLRPAFGHIFSDYLINSTFWGHCDIDIITDDILERHDVISARKNHIAGHFTLFRNTEQINSIYTSFPKFAKILELRKHTLFDELGMTKAIRYLQDQNMVNVYWPRFLLNFARLRTDNPSRLNGYTQGWYWNRGNLYDQTEGNEEIMYLHFMPWKRSLRKIDFDYEDAPEAFYISSTAIRKAIS
jgi:hypothetical protein